MTNQRTGFFLLPVRSSHVSLRNSDFYPPSEWMSPFLDQSSVIQYLSTRKKSQYCQNQGYPVSTPLCPITKRNYWTQRHTRAIVQSTKAKNRRIEKKKWCSFEIWHSCWG
ncbi:hypothetical protein AVEN_203718-1 [Araneus ventricosus]|uniref:Uncharacterized protein n=1 Tax=Araneus ventricosus TaxID=182803 RepID=A0A4Y2IRA6_ARAVE|nr:hypothetical protein AVEN_203718-1 [Araneus ventricosus]